MLTETLILFASCFTAFSFINSPKLTNSLRSSSFLDEDLDDRETPDDADDQLSRRLTFRRRKMEYRKPFISPTPFGRYAYRSGYGSSRAGAGLEHKFMERESPFHGTSSNVPFVNIFGADQYLFTNDLLSSFQSQPAYTQRNLPFAPERHMMQTRFRKPKGSSEKFYNRVATYFNGYEGDYFRRNREGSPHWAWIGSSVGEGYRDEAPSDTYPETDDRAL